MDLRPLILIVDDNATNLKLARVTLEFAGFEVAVAADADQARAAIAARPPRLILMDVQLPGTDGLTLTRELKADPRTADIRIVALSAYAMKGDDAKARAAGCDGYITTPVDTRTLGSVVAGYLAPAASVRLLVVEDNPAFGRLLRINLRDRGFEVVLVEDIESARAELSRARPALIVLDGMLRAWGDGMRFCRELKRAAETRAIPVILLSGSDGEDAKPGDPEGPNLSLSKTPEVLAALPKTVRDLLSRPSEPPAR